MVAPACRDVAWVYLLAGHGGFWRTDQRLPGRWSRGWQPERWPSVVAVVPARDEAAILPVTLPSLLAQDYPGEFAVLLVDDGSTDGTAEVAAALGAAAGAAGVRPGSRLCGWCAAGPPPLAGRARCTRWPPGCGPRGSATTCCSPTRTSAYAPGTLTALVRAAAAGDRALVSQMALLRADTGWERLIVPAFVYFFAQLYPFRWVNRPGRRTAAAAGGCMLVRRATLAAAGGLAPIRGARIDDVALGAAAQAAAVAGPLLAGVHHRGAQPPAVPAAGRAVGHDRAQRLRPAALLAGAARADPARPAVAVRGAAGGRRWPAWPGLAAGARLGRRLVRRGRAGRLALMSVSFLPVLRLYRLGGWRAPVLPGIALLYAAMTADSARRHYAGRGGEWKGRTVPAGRQAQ